MCWGGGLLELLTSPSPHLDMHKIFLNPTIDTSNKRLSPPTPIEWLHIYNNIND